MANNKEREGRAAEQPSSWQRSKRTNFNAYLGKFYDKVNDLLEQWPRRQEEQLRGDALKGAKQCRIVQQQQQQHTHIEKYFMIATCMWAEREEVVSASQDGRDFDDVTTIDGTPA